jgi:hypothetical protein
MQWMMVSTEDCTPGGPCNISTFENDFTGNLSEWDLAEWLERLTANAKVATVLIRSHFPAFDTVESEGRQMMQCWIKYKKIQKSPFNKIFKKLFSLK